jgi:hypothetical protein
MVCTKQEDKLKVKIKLICLCQRKQADVKRVR